MKRKKEYKTHPSAAKNPPKAEQLVNLDNWKTYGALAVILLISIIAYLPVFHNSLLAWDDNAYIRDNVLIHSFNLKEIFSHYVSGNWHPITVLTFALEYQFFGLNATGYHSVNLLLHLLNVLLVFYTVFLLSDKIIVALVASLLFGIHPLHVESVAWAAELKDLLYTFFFLASYIFYLKYLNDLQKKIQPINQSTHQHLSTSAHHPIFKSSNHQITTSSHLHFFTFSPFYILALLLFIFSLLSKAMAVSLPLVLILTDYFKGRKINRKTLLEKVPFFLLALILGVVAVIAQKSSGATNPTTLLSLPQRLVFASYGFVTYLVKLLFPINLSALYPYPQNEFDIPVQYYAYVLCFLGLAACVCYSRRFTKKIIFGMGFFTATVILVLQLLPVGLAIMADRYSYIPSIGIFYLAGEGFMYLWRSKKLKLPAIIVLSLFAVLFSVETYARCGVWKNDITLWTDVIDQYKTLEYVYYNRGIAFTNEKRNEEAVSDFTRAIELKPDYSGAYNNRGFIFMNQNRNEEAIYDFNKSIELKSDNAVAYFNRGILFVNERRMDEAVKNFYKAVELKPDYAEVYNSLGSFFVKQRKNDDAINNFNKAIELNSGYAEAYYNRGIVFVNEKRNAEAIKDFNKAIEVNPDYANAYNNRGILLVNEKRINEAIKDFNKAIELKPDYAEAYNNRGFVFVNVKRNDEAINDFNKAIELNPDYISAYNNKANLLFDVKRFEEAVSIYTKVIALKADYAMAYYKRGLAEYYSGKKDAACRDLKQAVSLGDQPAEDALAQICR
jgi:tetratricopeptide (TPR) repeat protein